MQPEALVGLGDHPALDFLNSTATPAQDTIELISDGRGYLRWLELAGLIDTGERETLSARFAAAELDGIAAAAVEVREWLRPLIAAWAGAERAAPGDEALARLNALLAAGSRHTGISRTDHTLTVRDRRVWSSPESLLALPAEAAADLFAHGDPWLVRNCEGPTCTLWFYDRTKAHQRRWCSMAVCGNRAKARAHRIRRDART